MFRFQRTCHIYAWSAVPDLSDTYVNIFLTFDRFSLEDHSQSPPLYTMYIVNTYRVSTVSTIYSIACDIIDDIDYFKLWPQLYSSVRNAFQFLSEQETFGLELNWSKIYRIAISNGNTEDFVVGITACCALGWQQ